MPNLTHFAIHADDLRRARRFYEGVFRWNFQPWGPPDFFLISTDAEGGVGVQGALQKRVDWQPGLRVHGYECTIAVTDVDATAHTIEQHDGTILMRRAAVPTVGWLVKFIDPEGNIANAMQYDGSAR